MVGCKGFQVFICSFFLSFSLGVVEWSVVCCCFFRSPAATKISIENDRFNQLPSVFFCDVDMNMT